jgi:hypothetical protein
LGLGSAVTLLSKNPYVGIVSGYVTSLIDVNPEIVQFNTYDKKTEN